MLHFCHLCPWCLSLLGPSSTFGLQWGREVCELCWVPAFSPESPSVERGNGQQHVRAPFSFTLEPRQTLHIIIGPNVQLILGRTEVLAEAEVTFQFHWEYKMTFWNFNSWHSWPSAFSFSFYVTLFFDDRVICSFSLRLCFWWWEKTRYQKPQRYQLPTPSMLTNLHFYSLVYREVNTSFSQHAMVEGALYQSSQIRL